MRLYADANGQELLCSSDSINLCSVCCCYVILDVSVFLFQFHSKLVLYNIKYSTRIKAESEKEGAKTLGVVDVAYMQVLMKVDLE